MPSSYLQVATFSWITDKGQPIFRARTVTISYNLFGRKSNNDFLGKLINRLQTTYNPVETGGVAIKQTGKMQ